jgi:hypothetical protein
MIFALINQYTYIWASSGQIYCFKITRFEIDRTYTYINICFFNSKFYLNNEYICALEFEKSEVLITSLR